jgi:hypothetical protein
MHSKYLGEIKPTGDGEFITILELLINLAYSS